MIALVVAAARDRAIGRDGDLPWRLSTDLRRFKRLTTGGTVVMGRKTWASIGRPLPQRTNRVLSRDPDFAPPGVQVHRSLTTALDGEVWVIGGAGVYAATAPLADAIHLSVVDCVVPDADTHLPALGPDWRITHREVCPASPRDDHAHTYLILKKDGVSPPFPGCPAIYTDT